MQPTRTTRLLFCHVEETLPCSLTAECDIPTIPALMMHLKNAQGEKNVLRVPNQHSSAMAMQVLPHLSSANSKFLPFALNVSATTGCAVCNEGARAWQEVDTRAPVTLNGRGRRRHRILNTRERGSAT